MISIDDLMGCIATEAIEQDAESVRVEPVVICEFLSGYLAAVQFLVIGHGMDSIAEEAMRESGYTEQEFLNAQKETGFETRKMNAIIRSAFDR